MHNIRESVRCVTKCMLPLVAHGAVMLAGHCRLHTALCAHTQAQFVLGVEATTSRLQACTLLLRVWMPCRNTALNKWTAPAHLQVAFACPHPQEARAP
jgi:ascorbate-specific PTS system EIIC-type component UlaA